MAHNNPYFETLKEQLHRAPQTWLVTGAAGFIGSHLVDALLRLDQRVIGLDNLSSGSDANLNDVRQALKPIVWSRFQFLQADIRDRDACRKACRDVEVVLHQAALCSVPASIEDPAGTHEVNVTGFLNVLEAARQAEVPRFVYASSCAVYGDSTNLPHVEDHIGEALSPYALSKYMNELYAGIFARAYGFSSVGLRYFNVFGPRQDPGGAYAAVIPRWITALLENGRPTIYGDGETTRDFCFVGNVVQANLLAAATQDPEAINQVYNIALNDRTSLNTLYSLVRDRLSVRDPALAKVQPDYQPPRAGDIRHSGGDISKASRWLHFQPAVGMQEGLAQTISWYEQ